MDAVLGQLIANSPHPIGQTEDFVNNENDRCFVFALGIHDEGLNRAVARFDIDPFAVSRRIVQTILAEIFVFLCVDQWCNEDER